MQACEKNTIFIESSKGFLIRERLMRICYTAKGVILHKRYEEAGHILGLHRSSNIYWFDNRVVRGFEQRLRVKTMVEDDVIEIAI